MPVLQIQRWVAVALVGGAGLARPVSAQLAITEVMPATRENNNTTFRGPEYWELTNFGTNEVSLHGYGFRDANPERSLTKDPFANLVIHPGESVIFFRVLKANQSVTTPLQFQAWWGESKLPRNLQCRVYASPGLSGWDGDAVWLLDPSSNVVDFVSFARARLGRSFTYDPQTGELSVLSAAGVDGAFAAELADDVGSPGFTTGPVGVRFLQEPLDQSADAGMTVSFAVVGAGLPRLRYQWFFMGTAVGSQPTLVLSNVGPAQAGGYRVLISNELSTATSAVATLTVNTNPTATTIVRPPADAIVFVGQTAVFTVEARGVPAPTYVWRTNGVVVSNQSGPKLELAQASAAWSGARCSVTVSNPLRAVTASALLTVTRRPDLRFTEVMALPTDEEANRHFDWFELTNYDTNAVNLAGWRFADALSFAGAFTITNHLTLQPGESAVVAERLNASLFARWWGADSLPGKLSVSTYGGLGLAAFGEVLYLWNTAATDPNDFVASVSWARATSGVSFECTRVYCDPEGHCLDDSIGESVLGVRGAFRAIENGDIGSPGYVANAPLQILSVSREPLGEVKVLCRVRAGGRYRLWRAPSLTPADWAPLALHLATNNVITLADHVPQTGSVWFYRVEEVP